MAIDVIEEIVMAAEIFEVFEAEQEKLARHMTQELLNELGLTHADIDDPEATLQILFDRGYEFNRLVQKVKTGFESILLITRESKTVFVDAGLVELNFETELITASSIEFDDDQLKHFKEVTDRKDAERKKNLH